MDRLVCRGIYRYQHLGYSDRLAGKIKNGRVYIAHEYWNNAKGFSFNIGDDGREVSIGGEFILKGRAKIKVNLPQRGLIRIIRDGEKDYEITDSKCYFEINDRGLYRVEAFILHL